MAGFGCYNPFPRSFGGDVRDVETTHRSSIEGHSQVTDIELHGLTWLELYADSALIANGWAASRRIANQRSPTKAMEGLPVWEEACGLRPLLGELATERRRTLSAKLIGLENHEAAIRDVCTAIMGSGFVELTWVDPADDVTYMPGVMPGPPGMDWASKRAIAFVEVTKGSLDQDTFDRLVGKLESRLDDLLPAWMGHNVFTHDTFSGVDGFYLDWSLLDEGGL